MKRFLATVAATAAAAAVAAAITIPAGADDGARTSQTDELTAFTSCLRAHGIPIPAGLEGVAAKEWIGAHQDTEGLEAAFQACEPVTSGPEKAPGPPPQELAACLRAKGFDPPATVDDFKRWTAQQNETSAGKEALNACGLVVDGEAKPAGGGCGAGKAQAARKAQASRARKPKAQTTPST